MGRWPALLHPLLWQLPLSEVKWFYQNLFVLMNSWSVQNKTQLSIICKGLFIHYPQIVLHNIWTAPNSVSMLKITLERNDRDNEGGVEVGGSDWEKPFWEDSSKGGSLVVAHFYFSTVVIHVDESQSLPPEVHWWLCLAKGRMVGWVGNHATMPCSVWWNSYILKAKKFAEPLFQSKKIAEKVHKSGRHFWAILGNFG